MASTVNDVANHFFEFCAAVAAAYAAYRSRQAKTTSEETAAKTEQIHSEVKAPEPNGLTTAGAINEVRDTVNRLGREQLSRDEKVEGRLRELAREISSVAKMVGRHMADDHETGHSHSATRSSRKPPASGTGGQGGQGGRGRTGT